MKAKQRRLPVTASTRYSLSLALLLGLSVMLTTGGATAEGSDTPAAATAQDYFNRGDYKTATVLLQNRLQDDPNDLAALTLLAYTFLKTRDYAKAEALFDQAVKAGIDPDRVAAGLAEAQYHQGKFEILLGFSDPDRPGLSSADRVALLVFRARAQRAMKDSEAARASLRAALATQPGAAAALEELAALAVAERDLDNAQDYIRAALAAKPDSARAWELQGTVHHLRHRFAAAVAAYERALAADPKAFTPLLWSGWSLVALGRLDEAAGYVERAYQQRPKDPVAGYLRGVIAFQRGDYRTAEQAFGEVLTRLPGDLRSKLLLAAVYYRNGDYRQAEGHLHEVLKAYPELYAAYSLLGRAILARGDSTMALRELTPILDQAPQDLGLRLVLAQAAIAANRLMDALGYLQGIERDPLDATAVAAIDQAISDLQNGLMDAATADIVALLDGLPIIDQRVGTPLAGADAAQTRQALAEVRALLRRKDYDRALAMVTDKLRPALPGQALPLVYAGMAQAGKRQVEQARASYTEALGLQVDNIPALLGLARLDEAGGDVAGARRRYQQALAQHPDAQTVLLQWAGFEFRQGRDEDGQRWLQQAIAQRPASPAPALALANHWLQRRDPVAARAAIQAVYQLQPRNLLVLDVLGRAALLAKDYSEAARVYAQLAELQPDKAYVQVQLGGAQLRSGHPGQAATTFERAWSLDPRDPRVAMTLAKVYLQLRRYDQALALAADLGKRAPGSPLGPALRGDVNMAQADFGAAVTAYQEAQTRLPTAAVAQSLARALLADGKGEEALSSLQTWLRQHPDDLTSRLALADTAAKLGKRHEARSHYQAVLKTEPDNALAKAGLRRLQGAGK